MISFVLSASKVIGMVTPSIPKRKEAPVSAEESDRMSQTSSESEGIVSRVKAAFNDFKEKCSSFFSRETEYVSVDDPSGPTFSVDEITSDNRNDEANSKAEGLYSRLKGIFKSFQSFVSRQSESKDVPSETTRDTDSSGSEASDDLSQAFAGEGSLAGVVFTDDQTLYGNYSCDDSDRLIELDDKSRKIAEKPADKISSHLTEDDESFLKTVGPQGGFVALNQSKIKAKQAAEVKKTFNAAFGNAGLVESLHEENENPRALESDLLKAEKGKQLHQNKVQEQLEAKQATTAQQEALIRLASRMAQGFLSAVGLCR